MAKLRRSRRRVARLSFEDGEVIVTPKDRSIFLISAEKATEACRSAVRLEEGIEQFESEFLVPLHNWCVTYAKKVRACYFQVPSGPIQVIIVTKNRQFDFDLAADMAKFELKLAQAGWQVGISQLPDADDESLGTFLSPVGTVQVYAEQGTAPEQGGKQPKISRKHSA